MTIGKIWRTTKKVTNLAHKIDFCGLLLTKTPVRKRTGVRGATTGAGKNQRSPHWLFRQFTPLVRTATVAAMASGIRACAAVVRVAASVAYRGSGRL